MKNHKFFVQRTNTLVAYCDNGKVYAIYKYHEFKNRL